MPLGPRRPPTALLAGLVLGAAAAAQDLPAPPQGLPDPLPVEGADAATPAEMRSYVERLPGTDVAFAMVPVPGGRFRMGSPEDEPGRGSGEGPVHEVEVAPFWMGRTEVTWDEFEVFQRALDLRARAEDPASRSERDAWADAVSRPTPPYVPMDFGMGRGAHPAVGMTQLAAKQYTKWLSMTTGRFHRLPTEAEWEHACRAGTTTAYSFGDDPAELDAHAWHYGNADGRYRPVGTRAPNPWGLHDLHGNVAEWVLDGWERHAYRDRAAAGEVAADPVVWPTERYPRVVRGGSWDDDPEDLRSAARGRSRKAWKVQDPQLPKSIWYHTDAPHVGFRVVRPLVPPPPETWERYWEPDLDEDRAILARQRAGKR